MSHKAECAQIDIQAYPLHKLFRQIHRPAHPVNGNNRHNRDSDVPIRTNKLRTVNNKPKTVLPFSVHSDIHLLPKLHYVRNKKYMAYLLQTDTIDQVSHNRWLPILRQSSVYLSSPVINPISARARNAYSTQAIARLNPGLRHKL